MALLSVWSVPKIIKTRHNAKKLGERRIKRAAFYGHFFHFVFSQCQQKTISRWKAGLWFEKQIKYWKMRLIVLIAFSISFFFSIFVWWAFKWSRLVLFLLQYTQYKRTNIILNSFNQFWEAVIYCRSVVSGIFMIIGISAHKIVFLTLRHILFA